MKFKFRKLATAGVATALVLGLSGCNPPMPPEMRAALAELSYTCVDGEAAMALPNAIFDLGAIWSDALVNACPGMTLIPETYDSESAALQVTSKPDGLACTPYASTPFAVDAAVVAFQVPDVYELYLDASTIAGIINGSIVSWDDPQIVATNPDYELPALELRLRPETDPETFEALARWVERESGITIDGSGLDLSRSLSVDELFELGDGELAIAHYSDALAAGAFNAAIRLGEERLAEPLQDNLVSAASQWRMIEGGSAGAVTVELDPSIEPALLEGFDFAVEPYQAIFPVYLVLCGEESLNSRAVSRFLLRLDQQGVLAGGAMLNVPETVRLAGLELVSAGLPEPSLPPELQQ